MPTNSKGRPIINQAFEFDDYDNIHLCLTNFADGKSDEAFYDFFEDSPFQLKSVSHTLTADYPALVTFTKDDYDADGNMLKDEQGNSLGVRRGYRPADQRNDPRWQGPGQLPL